MIIHMLRVVCIAVVIIVIPKITLADWKQITNSDSPIRFNAQGYYLGQAWHTSGAHADIWIANYNDASFYYGRAAAGGTMRGTRYPRDTLERWDKFLDKDYGLGQEGSSSSPQGDIDFQNFTYENKRCIVLSAIWGVRTSIQVYDRPNLLYGYICSNTLLSKEKIEGWLNNLEINN